MLEFGFLAEMDMVSESIIKKYWVKNTSNNLRFVSLALFMFFLKNN